MAFEQAWAIVKDVDFRIPRPIDSPAKYTEPNAVLAFHGSKIPMIHTHEQRGHPIYRTFLNESLRLPLRSAGRYEVGDFGEDMHEGKEAGSFLTPHHGITQVMDEIERASLVRAIMEAGIVDEREIEGALDEAAFADMRGEFHTRHHPETRRMGNERGVMTTRLGGGDLE